MSANFFWKAIVILILITQRDYKTTVSTGFGGAFAEGMRSDTSEEDVRDEDPRTPLYFLLLLMMPDVESAGWDNGPGLLAGARVALEEVNTRPGFLHGYRLELIESGHEACGLTTNGRGLLNLVDHAINPFGNAVRPVVAVGGLMCTESTTMISSVAGKPGIDLLQLSGSNSPVFAQDNESYPYQWRFLTSASVFGDLLKHLMDKFNWTRVAVLYDSNSMYSSEIALAFMKTTRNKIVVQAAISLTDTVHFEALLHTIKNDRVRIIFSFTDMYQTEKLLCLAEREGLIYPNYQWVLTDTDIDTLISTSYCPESELLAGANHALTTYFRLYKDPHEVLISNGTYEDYKRKYQIELEQIRVEYNAKFFPDTEYAGIVYDQVWALAMALNTAIPILEKANLSIEEYSYGQPEITNILQKELSKVKFVGASSQVHFSSNREVFTTVNIFRLQIRDENKELVGEYNGRSKIPLVINLTREEVPDDEWNPEVTLLPVFATSILLTADGLIMLFVTLNLVLIIVHRNRPELKAISPYLSMLMFIGCYILCASALCNIVLIGISINHDLFSILCNVHYSLFFNGVLLIFNTIFIRLLRVHKIFSIKNLTHTNKYVWNNCSLSVMIFALSLLPNVLLVIWLTTDRLSYHTDIEYIFVGKSLMARKVSDCQGDNIGIWLGVISGYIFLVAILILMLAISTRNIRYSNFKDTKKVNVFLGCLFSICIVSYSVGLILRDTGEYFAAADIARIVGSSLLVPILCQGFLFMPKVVPIICPKKCRESLRATSGLQSLSRVRNLSHSLSERLFW